jgi:hypothetical protein
MGVRQSFFTIALATLGLFTSPVAAHALSLSTVSSETELEALMSQPALIAEGQFGSISLNTYTQAESNIDFAWSNGEKQPLSLSYDGSTVRYTVGEQTLEAKIDGFFKDIFIYIKAAEDSTSLLLKNLVLTDSDTTLSISGIAASSPNQKLTIFGFHDISEGFTLTGNAIMSWLNPLQNPANLTYQIQVGNVESQNTVPDTDPDEAQPIESTESAPKKDGEMDWFPWFSDSESDRYCASL